MGFGIILKYELSLFFICKLKTSIPDPPKTLTIFGLSLQI